MLWAVLILQPFVQRQVHQEFLGFPLLPGRGVGKDRLSYFCHQVEILPGMATIRSPARMALKVVTLWSVMPCCLVEAHRLLGGTHCLYLHVKDYAKLVSLFGLLRLLFYPENGGSAFLQNPCERSLTVLCLCLTYFPTLKIEPEHYSGSLINFYQNAVFSPISVVKHKCWQKSFLDIFPQRRTS